MTFHSILSEGTADGITPETLQAPSFFPDLNLDQIIDIITTGKEQYNLKPFFHTSLTDTRTIHYRHEIMCDLEHELLFQYISAFSLQMRTMREHLAQANKRHYQYQKQYWFLEAVEIYCRAVRSLVDDLTLADLNSRGFRALREYVIQYAESERFTSLLSATKNLKAALSSIKYCVLIKGSTIRVRKYESEINYSADVEKTFAKFQQGAVKDYAVKFPSRSDLNHIEAQILDSVAKLYPEIFSDLNNYCAINVNYLDHAIGVFDREIQFYLAYLDYIAIFKKAGLQFCYPKVSADDKELYSHEGFDLALAYKIIAEQSTIVCNDFYLKNQERIFVVSGPNQGGKTTFARAFGQLHFLASLGCPVPGKEAKLFLFDRMFTHFEKEEDLKNHRGKLEDDLIRMYEILNQLTSRSIVILNESFTSTTLNDAIFLSKKVLDRIIRLDLLCVCVTFIDELASLSEQTVSMVSTVLPDDPASRTFKIIRRPADGLSYAISIAEKHRVTYDRLKERIKS
jgi:DNA mismatch repair protein MutS